MKYLLRNLIQILVVIAVLCLIAWYLNPDRTEQRLPEPQPSPFVSLSDNLDYGVPGECDLLIERVGYALGYNAKWRQAAWVSYRLTASEVASNACRRTNLFKKDPDIAADFSLPQDYLNSGFDRGHLAPAADMHW